MKGANNLYTSLNGNMYTFLGKDGSVGLRLSKPDRDAFIAKYKTVIQEQYSAVMKEYVKVPGALLSKPKELAPYVAMSHEYVKTLKPKPTTKKE